MSNFLQLREWYPGKESPFQQFSLRSLHGDLGAFIDVAQYQHPSTTNQTSLIVKITHRGLTRLLTGDIDEKVIGALVKDPQMQYFSLAMVLK